MSYYVCWGHCIGCGALFSFNPHKVPSSSAITGEREPVCETCIHRINAKRRQMGLVPFEINPDAYDPVDEGGM